MNYIPSPWRDAQGIAEYIGYDVKTVHRLTGPTMTGTDRLPFHRLTVGGRKRFHVEEVTEWLREREG